MKRRITFVLTAVIALLLIGVSLLLMFGHTQKETDDIAYYRALSGETEGAYTLSLSGSSPSFESAYELPRLSELEPYEDYRFNYTAMAGSLFRSDAYVLILEYSADHYALQKSMLEQKYAYCTADSPCVEAGIDVSQDGIVYKMGDFDLRAVEGDNYPKEMLFIGTSDTRQEIAIVYFYDPDLDHVSTPFGKFLDEYTGWSKVEN